MPTTITITVHDDTVRAFNQRFAGAGLTLESLSQCMLRAACNDAPEPVSTIISNARGDSRVIWGEVARGVRAEVLQEHAAQFRLAAAVREVAAMKDRQ